MTHTKKQLLPWGMLPAILSLAWPTMLEQWLNTAVQYVDTAMVGSLGTVATAAVGSTTTVNWLVGSTVSALGVGFLAFISQADGAGRHEDARRASAQAVLMVLVFGTLFTALTLSLAGMVPVWMQVDASIPGLRETASQYFFILYMPMLFRTASIVFGMVLRAAGDTKTPMLVGVGVNLVNVVFNFLLIYPTRTVRVLVWELWIPGAGLGVIGAAIASTIAFTVGGIVITVALWRHPRISPRGCSVRPDWAILRPCLRVAAPNALQRFGTSLGYVVFATMVNSLGGVATAAHTIANTVESAFYVPGYGMQTAAATLAGNAYGARDERKLRELSRMILFVEIVLMILSGGLLYVVAPAVMTLFSKDAAVIMLGTTVLRMVAFSEPFFGFSIVVEGMMQGVGKTVQPFIFGLAGMWGVRIAGTFLCTQLLDGTLVSAWGCMIAHNLLLFVLYAVCYLRGRLWKFLAPHAQKEKRINQM